MHNNHCTTWFYSPMNYIWWSGKCTNLCAQCVLQHKQKSFSLVFYSESLCIIIENCKIPLTCRAPLCVYVCESITSNSNSCPNCNWHRIDLKAIFFQHFFRVTDPAVSSWPKEQRTGVWVLQENVTFPVKLALSLTASVAVLQMWFHKVFCCHCPI